MASGEEICARLCLLTRAAWEEGLPAPLSRRAVRRMVACGALQNLVLRRVPGVDAHMMERARVLLSRAHAVYTCMQAYQKQGYEIVTPKDAAWPERLYALGGQMPQFLFLKGNACLLRSSSVAVAGSRVIRADTRRAAERCGLALAQEEQVMITGDAVGVDACAQRACLLAGGRLVLVPARSVQQAMRDSLLVRAMHDGRLLLACDTLPDEPFSAQKALMRNHTIYALGHAAIVVAARNGMGGSWRGATDCLQGGWCSVYVPDTDQPDMQGNRALLKRGARRIDLELPLLAQMKDERLLQTQMRLEGV